MSTTDTPNPTDEAVAAQLSPLDQSFRRGNPRQHHGGPSLWDVREAMQTPNMAFAPEQITELPEYEALDGWGVSTAVEALKSLQDAVTRLIAGRESYREAVDMTEAAQVLAVHDLHSKLMPLATKTLDAAHSTVGKAIAVLEAEFKQPVTEGARGPFSAEVRAYVRSLDMSGRMRFFNEALSNGDMTALGACLGAPAYLSGLDPEAVPVLTERANVRRNPLAAKRLALLKGAQAKLESAGSIAVASYDGMVGAKDATVRRLREQRQKRETVIGAIAPTA